MQLIKHPVIADRMTRLRDRDLPHPEFRQLVIQIAALMVPEVTASLPTRIVEVETPLAITTGERLVSPIVLAPILRAGLGLAEGFHQSLPEATVAHVGLARNEETLEPETYYFNTPGELAAADVIVLDPMLATGGSAAAAITKLKEAGASRLRFACLVACPEGVEGLREAHPDVPVFAAALDDSLDHRGYILPGLGDAGDRTFGTA